MLFIDVDIIDISIDTAVANFMEVWSTEPVTPEGNKQTAANEQKPFERLLKSEMKSWFLTKALHIYTV